MHQCYFFWTGRFLVEGVGIPGNWVMPVMSIGQIAEIGTMAFLGYCLKQLGWRYTMVIGILGGIIGGALFNAAGGNGIGDGGIGSIFVAFVGACALLFIMQAIGVTQRRR